LRLSGGRARPPRRTLAAVAAAGSLALAGCGGVSTALSQEQATVNFRPDTTTATVRAAGQACGAGPGLAPAAAPAVPGTAGAPSALRYDVSRASPADLARLQRCLLLRFPGAVLGVSLKDTGTRG
jgi:hypothetical protein